LLTARFSSPQELRQRALLLQDAVTALQYVRGVGERMDNARKSLQRLLGCPEILSAQLTSSMDAVEVYLNTLTAGNTEISGQTLELVVAGLGVISGMSSRKFQDMVETKTELDVIHEAAETEIASRCLEMGMKEYCRLCWEDDEDHSPCTLRCGHDFHVGCFREWMKRNINCPVCGRLALDALLPLQTEANDEFISLQEVAADQF
jgi:hypothetical protein